MKKTMCQSVSALAALTALIGMPAVASAQAARSGPTFSTGGVPITTLPDAAYDSIHDRYLVVAESANHTVIDGKLLDAAGTRISSFVISAAPAAGATQMPRVAFGPDVNGGAGGYLVVWHETPTGGNFTQVKARLISADGTALSATFLASTEAGSATSSTCWIMGAPVAYSTVSHEFLIAWMGSYNVTEEIRFMRVGLTGALLQATPTGITSGTKDWERDPTVAYNPDDDEFFIAYAGFWDARGYAYVTGRRVKAGTGAVVSAPVEYAQTFATYFPAVTYNLATKQYLLSWYHRTRSVAAVYGVNLSRDGAAAGAVTVLSSRYFAYDANDLKYNPVSGDYLVVTHGNNPEPWEDAAVSIKSDGTPYDNGFIVTHTTDVRALMPNPANTDGNFYPRITASTATGKWLLVTSSLFKAINGQLVASSNTATPGTPTNPDPPSSPQPPAPPPPPPAPVSNPMFTVDSPSNNATVLGTGFLISGWAVDTGAPSGTGTGIDVVVCWAYPKSGAGAILAGVASYGHPRPDVGAWLGTQFTQSGYGLMGVLPPGAYTFVVYAHSTVNGSWGIPKTLDATVLAPVSTPKMWVDLPSQNQTVSQNFIIAGWSLDLGSSTGTGVDALHIYAYPAGGSAPIFLGVGQLGDERPDVATAFGSSRFTGAGFHLVVTTLTPGDYTLVVFSHSSVSGTFNNTSVVPVKVR
jgi:hypothetical protein